MSKVSPDSPGTLASGGLEQPVRLPLPQAITAAAPGKQLARQVVQLVITGDRPVINYISQHTADGGTNSSVASSQTASGADSRVTGGQALQPGDDAVIAGQFAAVLGTGETPVKEGWWRRLRKRGAVVALCTIIGAIAGVAGVVVTILIAAGWTP
jgi:hypothetical protein